MPEARPHDPARVGGSGGPDGPNIPGGPDGPNIPGGPDGPTPDSPEDTYRLKAILTFCASIAFAAAPLMTAPFTGFDPGAFAHPITPMPLQPAGYAFSIWGLIYLGLIASTGYGLFARASDPAWDRGRWPLFAAMILGAAWIGVAQLNPSIATLLLFVMLICALITLRARPDTGRLWHDGPVGLFAGWLTAASFVAAATILSGHTGLAPPIASFLGLFGVLILATGVGLTRPPLSYAAGLIWALIGVAVAGGLIQGQPRFFDIAVLGAIVVVAALTWRVEQMAR